MIRITRADVGVIDDSWNDSPDSPESSESSVQITPNENNIFTRITRADVGVFDDAWDDG